MGRYDSLNPEEECASSIIQSPLPSCSTASKPLSPACENKISPPAISCSTSLSHLSGLFTSSQQYATFSAWSGTLTSCDLLELTPETHLLALSSQPELISESVLQSFPDSRPSKFARLTTPPTSPRSRPLQDLEIAFKRMNWHQDAPKETLTEVDYNADDDARRFSRSREATYYLLCKAYLIQKLLGLPESMCQALVHETLGTLEKKCLTIGQVRGRLESLVWDIGMMAMDYLVGLWTTTDESLPPIPGFLLPFALVVCRLERNAHRFTPDQITRCLAFYDEALRSRYKARVAEPRLHKGYLRTCPVLAATLFSPAYEHLRVEPDEKTSEDIAHANRSTMPRINGFCYLHAIGRTNRRYLARRLGPCAKEWYVRLFAYATCGPTAHSRQPLLRSRRVNRKLKHYYILSKEELLDTDPSPFAEPCGEDFVGASRSTYANALDLVGSTIHKDAVLDSLVAPVANAIRNSQELCPHQVKEPNFSKLQSRGLPVDPNAVRAHPHPAMKALETDMLETLSFSVFDECTVLFMKDQKFNKLARKQPLFVRNMNPSLTVRDRVRWSSTLDRLQAPITTPNVFLHDTGHYLTPPEVCGIFNHHPQVDTIFFSAILPDEIVLDEPSWHPSLYRWEQLSATEYAFILAEDGESYEQPYRTLSWLKTNEIRNHGTGEHHGVSIIKSLFAHKLFCITRKQTRVKQEWRITDSPDDVILPDIDGRIFAHSKRRVPREVFNSVFAHSMSLTAQKFSSTASKVRTFQSNPKYSDIDGDTWHALAQVCYALSLSPAVLEREAQVNTYAALLARTFRRTVNQYEWLLPALTGIGFGVSWGSLLLPLIGINIPDADFGPNVRVPGWAYGATAAVLSQGLLVAFGQSVPSTTSWFLRSLALVIPHVAYLLPDLTIGPHFRIPSYVGGIASSLVITGIISYFDRSGSHYEVKDLLNRMPHRVTRKWPLAHVDVYFVNDGHRHWTWTYPTPGADPDSPPPSYDSPSSPPTAASHLGGQRFNVNIPEWMADVSVASPPSQVSFPTSASSNQSSVSFPTIHTMVSDITANVFPDPSSTASSSTDVAADPNLLHAPPSPPDSPSTSLTPSEACTHSTLYRNPSPPPTPPPEPPIVNLPPPTPPPAPPVVHLPPKPAGEPKRPSPPRGKPLRSRFGLLATDVYEKDADFSLPDPTDGFVPALPSGVCLLQAFEQITGVPVLNSWHVLCMNLPQSELTGAAVIDAGLSTYAAVVLAYHYDIRIRVLGDVPQGHPEVLGVRDPSQRILQDTEICLYISPGHWSAVPPSIFRGAAPPPSYATPQALHRQLTPFEQYLSKSTDWTGEPVLSPWQTYYTSPARAKPYARDLKNGFTGTLRSSEGKGRVPPDFTASVDAMVDLARPRPVVFTAVLGAPGSSKSSGLFDSLKARWTWKDSFWKVSTPRARLRESISSTLALGNLSWKVGTFETNIFKTGSCLIIDEISQMPPGYVDYCLIRDSTIKSVIVIGDVTQGEFHEPNADSSLNASGSEALYFRSFCSRYRAFSNSIPRAVSSAIGLPTRSRNEGFVELRARPNASYPMVCASEGEAKMYSTQGYNAFTFGTVQGQRFEHLPVQISVSNATASIVSRGDFTSAMCRSNVGVIFIFSGTYAAQKSLASDPLLSSIFNGNLKHRYVDLFATELRGLNLWCPSGLFDPMALNETAPPAFAATPLPTFRLFRGRTTELPRERASDALDALLTAAPDTLPEHLQAPTDFSRGPATSGFDETETYLIESYGEIPVRESRESYNHLDQSKQFDDAPWYYAYDNLSRMEQLFPRQRNDDPVTFHAAVDKRLRFASETKNRDQYTRRAFTGPLLFDGWCRTTGVEEHLIPPFNPELYAQCILENEFTKLTKKTQATLLNNADRADPDWRHTYVRIFIKSQLKVKLETLLSPFKAGQTLASFQDSVILVTGPMTRYLTLVAEPLYRPEYYYHPGHSPLQLSTWCQKHWKSVPLNSTNDYTEFDQSQTGEALALEMVKLRAFGIPQHIMEYYFELKVGLSCQFGDLAVMRFTGEGPTLLFNSDFNAAVTGCQYELPPTMAVAVAGDDLAVNGQPTVRPGWESFRKFLTIKAKPEILRTASFCSWLLTPHGAIKEPRVVFAKLMIARDRQEEKKVIPSLMAEVAVGYHVGDHVYEHLDDLTLATHFWLIRYFILHAPLRFQLLLTTRSFEDVLARVWALLDASAKDFLDSVNKEIGALWMLEAKPARIAASILLRVGGFQLGRTNLFDNIYQRIYRY